MCYILLAIAIIIIGFYCYLTNFGKKEILSNETKKTKTEIPITYNIGWWSYQSGLIINDLDVKIVESNLNLFSSKSLISYKIKGHIKFDGKWKPYIKEVHISERLNKKDPNLFYRTIELTPIVGVKKNKKLNGSKVSFEFTNEHIITSTNWGLNKLKIVCENKEKVIDFFQGK